MYYGLGPEKHRLYYSWDGFQRLEILHNMMVVNPNNMDGIDRCTFGYFNLLFCIDDVCWYEYKKKL